MSNKSRKQIQQEQLELFRQQKAAAEKAKKKKERMILLIFAAVFILIVAGVLLGIIGTRVSKDNGNYYREKIAFESQYHKVDYATFSCFVYDAFEAYQAQEGDLSYYGLDVTLPLESQQYNEGLSWEDFFISLAEDDIASYLFLADSATVNGFSLTDEQLAEIDTKAQTVADYSVYGRGINVDDVRNMLTLKTLATEYAEYKEDLPTFTDAQITEHYEGSKIAYDKVDYVSFYIDIGEGYPATTTDEALALAQKVCDYDPTDADSLLEAGKKVLLEAGIAEDTDFTEYLVESTDVTMNETGSTEFQDWAYESKVGDTVVFAGETAVEVAVLLKTPAPGEKWKEEAETSLRNSTYDGWYADNFATFTYDSGKYTLNEMVTL